MKQHTHWWLKLIHPLKKNSMRKSVKKLVREEYNRLKKVIEKIVDQKKEEALSQLVLQPVRQKKLREFLS